MIKPSNAVTTITSQACAALMLLLLPSGAQAQPYPARSIRLIVPVSAGGSTDLAARVVAQKLGENLGQNVVVDNRPGAGSVIGTDTAAKANPDGYTLLIVAASFTSSPSLYKKLPYDAARDFAAVTEVAALPHLVALHPAVPVKSIAELIALAKAKPGQLNYSSGGVATASDMATHLFMHITGTDMVNIPYKGGGPAVTALVAGECQLNFATISNVLPHARTGRLRALAVTTARRSVAAPEYPTVAEAGVPEYEFSSWIGMLAPARTPQPILTRLAAAAAAAVQSQEVKSALLRDGLESVGNTPAQFASIIRSEIARWAQVVKAANIQAQ